MRLPIRDLLWLLVVIVFAAFSVVEYRAARKGERLLAQKQSELAAAGSRQAALNTQIAGLNTQQAELHAQIAELNTQVFDLNTQMIELQVAIDGYESHGELIRRFLLMHLRLRP